MTQAFFYPAWPKPANVQACVTLRTGGASQGAYASNNLGVHVGDRPEAVASNRRQLATATGVTHWQWLTQVHGTAVARVSGAMPAPSADACITHTPGLALAVLTADCLPILLCDDQGREVACAHAGWRGLAAGVLGNTVAAFHAPAHRLCAYIGPAIGVAHFEVDRPVVDVFATTSALAGTDWRSAFSATPGKTGHWQADLARLAKLALKNLGVAAVYGGELCTYAESTRFYSYRREPTTGRFATAIWRT